MDLNLFEKNKFFLDHHIRMKFFHLTIIVILIIFFPLAAFAGPAAYLDFDPGARPSGMGSAFTALCDDANAVLFNPAGLTNMDANDFEAAGSFGILSRDRFNDFFGLSEQLEHRQFWGLDIIHYVIDDIPGMNINSIPTSTLQDIELALGGAYAYEFDYHWKVGGHASFLYQNLTGVNAYGFGGIDLGILFVPFTLYDFTLGGSIRHLGGVLSWNTGSNPALAPDLRLGASLKLFDQLLTLVYDAEQSFQSGSNLQHHVGGEIWIERFAALRGGVDSGNPTLGASARYKNYELDYSYEFKINGLGDFQRISADLFF